MELILPIFGCLSPIAKHEKSAMKIGELVLSKIRNEEDPSITIEEVNKTIRIDYER